MKHYDRLWADVDLDCIRHNIMVLKQNISSNTKILAVIKVDAYGHGAVPIAKEIEDMDAVYGFAAATIEEALILRKAAVKKPILVLGYTFPYCYKEMIREDIYATVFKTEMAEEISKMAVSLGKTAKVHIKVDTGMSRIGIQPDEVGLSFIEKIKELPNIEIHGIFTHFAKADEKDKTYTKKQLLIFEEFVKKTECILGFTIPYKHCSNSAATIEIKEANMNLVRPGIAIYGLWPSGEVDKSIVDLKPALTLKSHIIHLKEMETGAKVSYGGTFSLERKTKIATIPIGYGDGYPRALSNNGWMLVNGKKAPIIGKVCMDQCMIDVTDIPSVKDGDEVIIIGKTQNEELWMEELGDISGRFNYELACELGKRIPRIYWKNGKQVGSKDYFDDYK